MGANAALASPGKGFGRIPHTQIHEFEQQRRRGPGKFSSV
jgi:hypothetical protein